MTAENIAQWVIDNRYPKSENDKMSDHELFHQLVDKIRDAERACLERAAERAEMTWGELKGGYKFPIVDKSTITDEGNLI
jgi:hypothetical protein